MHTNHNSEQRARKWEGTYADDPEIGPVDSWDWKEATRTSSRLNRFLRRHAAGTLNRRVVLVAAWQSQLNGEIRLKFP